MEWIESANVFNALNRCRKKTNATLVKYFLAELSVYSEFTQGNISIT